ncbi:MAG: glycine zipper 2TM domain-containing protein [Magnetococcales bacterium]|nr:glycine zipper 2TM domain-containing protein [Magnetococcales bacterium]
MKKFLIVLLAILILPQIKSAQADASLGAGIGALGGALTGSLLGPDKNREQFALIGAATGGLLGYAIGNEREKGQPIYSHGQSVSTVHHQQKWIDPDTRWRRGVTTERVIIVDDKVCRNVDVKAFINGSKESLSGLACLESDGKWHLVNRSQPQIIVLPTKSRPDRFVSPTPYYYSRSYPSPVVIYESGNRRGQRGQHRNWR